MVVLVFLVAAYALIIYSYFAEESDKRAQIVGNGTGEATGDYIEIDVGIVAVDLQKETVEARLEFKPFGSLAGANRKLARPLTLHVSSINAEPLEFSAGRVMEPRDVTFDLHSGEVTDYPFDSHKALIEFAVEERSESAAQPKALRAEVDFFAYHHGLNVEAQPLGAADGGYAGFEAKFARSKLVKGVAIFCMAVMWGLAVSAIMVLVAVVYYKAETDMDKMTLLSGLIIALYFFRAGLPDSPTIIGTLSDYLSFFWAEAIVSVVTIGYTWIWFQRAKEKKLHQQP